MTRARVEPTKPVLEGVLRSIADTPGGFLVTLRFLEHFFYRSLTDLALTSLVKFIIFVRRKSREMWDRANLGSSATSTLFRSSSASKLDVGGGGVQDDEEVKNKFELGGLFPILLAGELREVTFFVFAINFTAYVGVHDINKDR